MSTVKNELRNSFIWNAIENVSRMGIQFIIGVILARLLNASDYGILGIISVFIAISQTLIDAGFSNALIQKKECNKEDYSTVFWINISIALLVFLILYIAAPWVSLFYESEVLMAILRVMGLSMVIQSLYTVHKVKLTKDLKFKTLAYIAFLSSILSGFIAIICAYMGWGVWALATQTILAILMQGVFIVYFSHWKPLLLFSKDSFKQLFNFGSKLLVSNLLYTVFNNIYNLVIGKVFQPVTLGYFTRADGYAKLVPNNVSGILQNIMLPVLSKQQDDDEGLKRIYTKFVKLTSFFIYPMSLLFCVLAKPMIILMLTDKWANTIPFLQVLCIASLFDHLISINNNYLMVKGKSDYILRLSASSKVFLILVLVASFRFGIIAVAWSKFVYYIITFFISSYYLKKSMNIGMLHVLKCTSPIFLASALVALFAWGITLITPMAWWSFLSTGVISMAFYYLLCRFFLKEELQLVKLIKS